MQAFQRLHSFDGVIRHPGEQPEPPPRPWTRLRNDPRVEAFIGASLEELHERNMKAEQKKQVDAQVRQASADLGGPGAPPPAQTMMGSVWQRRHK